MLRKESAVIATYPQLTEAYINQGQMDQAAAVLEILVELEPQNAQHRSKLEFVRGKLRGRRRRPPRPPSKAVAERHRRVLRGGRTSKLEAAPRGAGAPTPRRRPPAIGAGSSRPGRPSSSRVP